ncbi:ferredoxin reductase family protein [Neorhizobium petrolearium]|uniref:ferredoxin reductase family protein n=1 Tax=Neorhizobium petrolearium TaxID=515361 RepID=UPI003F815457
MTRPVLAHVILLLLGAVLPLFLLFEAAGHLDARNFLALSCGVIAFCLMAVNLFLAARPRGLERLIGGLDRIYFAHKWIGISVFLLILPHKYVGMRLDGLTAGNELAKLSVDVASYTFPVLATLLVISALKRLPRLPFEIPYQFWRVSHRLLGVAFMAIAFHQFFVKVPFSANAMISSYLTLMAFIGVVSFVFTQVLAWLRRRRYEVVSVEKLPRATVIGLRPVGRGIRVRPGGFAFLSIHRGGLREPHPFTVSAIGEDGSLQFSIGPAGDFTRRLRDTVAVGDRATVEGGYGCFDLNRFGERQVWLAGGIGITPFLAWAESLGDGNGKSIALIHCVPTPEDAVGQERLQAISERAEGFTYHVHASKRDGRMNAEALLKAVPFPIRGSDVCFCGPAPLRQAITRDLRRLGEQPQGIHFEKFEFR